MAHLSEALTSSGKFSEENGFRASSPLAVSGHHRGEGGGRLGTRSVSAPKTVREDELDPVGLCLQ